MSTGFGGATTKQSGAEREIEKRLSSESQTVNGHTVEPYKKFNKYYPLVNGHVLQKEFGSSSEAVQAGVDWVKQNYSKHKMADGTKKRVNMSKQIYKDHEIETKEVGGGKWKAQVDGEDLPEKCNTNADAFKFAKKFIDDPTNLSKKCDGPEAFDKAVEKKMAKRLSEKRYQGDIYYNVEVLDKTPPGSGNGKFYGEWEVWGKNIDGKSGTTIACKSEEEAENKGTKIAVDELEKQIKKKGL
jgi:hypothetical protein